MSGPPPKRPPMLQAPDRDLPVQPDGIGLLDLDGPAAAPATHPRQMLRHQPQGASGFTGDRLARRREARLGAPASIQAAGRRPAPVRGVVGEDRESK
jgi:hypothetical protein